MRDFVASLYVVGAVVTALGVYVAYRRARRDLSNLEAVRELNKSVEDFDLLAAYEDPDGAKAGRAQREADQARIDQAVREIGLTEGAPDFRDLRVPLEFWAKRSALKDAVASFKSGGVIALAGLAISTVASVWSLYLPAA
jgi:hypothetical protein